MKMLASCYRDLQDEMKADIMREERCVETMLNKTRRQYSGFSWKQLERI